MHVLQATKIARQIIRDAIPSENITIYTNKYNACRTVKCYATSPAYRQKIREQVAKHIPDATVSERSPIHSWSAPSLIIRIPN